MLGIVIVMVVILGVGQGLSMDLFRYMMELSLFYIFVAGIAY